MQLHPLTHPMVSCTATAIGYSSARTSFFARGIHTAARTSDLESTKLTADHIRRARRLKSYRQRAMGRVRVLTSSVYASARAALVTKSREHIYSERRRNQLFAVQAASFGRSKSPRSGQYLRRQGLTQVTADRRQELLRAAK